MVVGTRRTVDIGVNSLAVEHLTRDAGVPGLIPGPVTHFHLYFFVFVHSSHHYLLEIYAVLQYVGHVTVGLLNIPY